MGSSRSSKDWKPRWSFEDEPHAAVIFTTALESESSPARLYGKAISLLVARFLDTRQNVAAKVDLSSDASFLYVLIGREPEQAEEQHLQIESGGAIVEFGFGASPAASEEWPTVPLRDLVASAVEWLRQGES